MLSAPDIEHLGGCVSGYQPLITLEKLEEECSGNPELKAFLDDFIEYCLRYTETVCQFRQIVKKKEQDAATSMNEIDALRHNVHNALISSAHVLSRQMKQYEKDDRWYPKVPDRCALGRLALILAFSYIKKHHELQLTTPNPNPHE